MTTVRCCCKLNKLLTDCNTDISPTTSKVSLLYGKYRLSFKTVNGNKTLKQVLNFNKTLKQVLNFNKTLKQVRNFNKTIKQVRDFSKMVKQMSNSYFRSMRRTVLY